MHDAIKFTQSAWLKPWIGLNTDFRKVSPLKKEHFNNQLKLEELSNHEWE